MEDKCIINWSIHGLFAKMHVHTNYKNTFTPRKCLRWKTKNDIDHMTNYMLVALQKLKMLLNRC